MLDAITLQRVQIIPIAELTRQVLQDRPVAVAAFGADLAFKKILEIPCDPVVVQQGVVHVNEEHKVWLRHDIPGEKVTALTPSPLIVKIRDQEYEHSGHEP